MHKFFYLLLIVFILTGCQNNKITVVQKEAVAEPLPVVPKPQPVQTVSLVAVGDIMSHLPQLRAASSGGEPNYDYVFELVKPYISKADVAVANLETPLAGAEQKYSGYPRFNAPDALAESLHAAGFDLLTTANNHALDKGETGLLRTIATLDKLGLRQVGTARSPLDRDTLEVMEVQGVKLAFLAYTYGTNGIPVPADKPYLVNLLEQDRVFKDIENAKQKADFVIVLPHWGNEYWRQPSENQRQLAALMVEAGADLVLGSHPHVLEPYELIKRADGSGTGLVAYSLGNFVSAQKDRYTDTGMMLQVRLSYNRETFLKTVTVEEFIPTWVQRRRGFVIIPLEGAVPTADITAAEQKQLEQAKLDTYQLLKGLSK